MRAQRCQRQIRIQCRQPVEGSCEIGAGVQRGIDVRQRRQRRGGRAGLAGLRGRGLGGFGLDPDLGKFALDHLAHRRQFAFVGCHRLGRQLVASHVGRAAAQILDLGPERVETVADFAEPGLQGRQPGVDGSDRGFVRDAGQTLLRHANPPGQFGYLRPKRGLVGLQCRDRVGRKRAAVAGQQVSGADTEGEQNEADKHRRAPAGTARGRGGVDSVGSGGDDRGRFAGLVGKSLHAWLRTWRRIA